MEYCLVIERKFFVDPHGSPDLGGIKKRVAIYKPAELKWGVEYCHDPYENPKVFDIYGDNGYAQDGYNHIVDTVKYKAITKEQYDIYLEVIKIYDAI